MTPPRPDRVRLRFAKFGRIRFTSHRDLARVWERSLRRGRVPVSYSEGFSPRPRLRFGLALATAHESCGEYLDIDLEPGTIDAGLDLSTLGDQLAPTLPEGLELQALGLVAAGTPSLQEAVDACTWLVQVPGLASDRAEDAVAALLAADELQVTRTRKGKTVTDDIRPAVAALAVAAADDLPSAAQWPHEGTLLRAELTTHPRACRPAELLAAIDPALAEGRVVRLHQWTTVDGVRCEPLPLSGEAIARPSAPHAPARAS